MFWLSAKEEARRRLKIEQQLELLKQQERHKKEREAIRATWPWWRKHPILIAFLCLCVIAILGDNSDIKKAAEPATKGTIATAVAKPEQPHKQTLPEYLGDDKANVEMQGVHFVYITRKEDIGLWRYEFSAPRDDMPRIIKWLKAEPQKSINFKFFVYRVHGDLVNAYGNVSKDQLLFRLTWSREEIEKMKPDTMPEGSIIRLAEFQAATSQMREVAAKWCMAHGYKDGDICRKPIGFGP